MNSKIPVTKPFLPDLNEFIPYLEEIWDNQWLTNNGPFHQQLEKALCEYLNVEHISLFNNATIALITALRALKISGEVITTPYSFVATSHSILWNGLTPVFVDIDPETFNIDPQKIEKAITSNTTAIMPVHCYGNPCNVDAIDKIAKKHNLKVIYDAAHAFGINYHEKSILSYGDLSILSFHATKVFNTFEGGAIISPDLKTKQHIDLLKNFGFANETSVTELGINGKMSEINAAFGLLQLKHIDSAIEKRRKINLFYKESLKNTLGIKVPSLNSKGNSNFSYFPIIVEQGYKLSRDELYEKLKENDILSRRYFFPLISDMAMYNTLPSAAPANLPHAKEISEGVLCIPIYYDLDIETQKKIISLINNA